MLSAQEIGLPVLGGALIFSYGFAWLFPSAVFHDEDRLAGILTGDTLNVRDWGFRKNPWPSRGTRTRLIHLLGRVESLGNVRSGDNPPPSRSNFENPRYCR